MIEWEYKIETWDTGCYSWGSIERDLIRLGKYGWELVSTNIVGRFGGEPDYIASFKRPIQNKQETQNNEMGIQGLGL